MRRRQKITLGYIYRTKGCLGLLATCVSMRCNGKYTSFIPVPELLIDRKIPESARLDEIEARLKCHVQDQGRSRLARRPNWTPAAPGAGVSITCHSWRR